LSGTERENLMYSHYLKRYTKTVLYTKSNRA